MGSATPIQGILSGGLLPELPVWFAPQTDRPALGYHREPSRWSVHGERLELRTVGRGQEFVFDVRL